MRYRKLACVLGCSHLHWSLCVLVVETICLRKHEAFGDFFSSFFFSFSKNVFFRSEAALGAFVLHLVIEYGVTAVCVLDLSSSL